MHRAVFESIHTFLDITLLLIYLIHILYNYSGVVYMTSYTFYNRAQLDDGGYYTYSDGTVTETFDFIISGEFMAILAVQPTDRILNINAIPYNTNVLPSNNTIY